MQNKILVVEDEFIEANELRNMLEHAGHFVCGIAKSYDQALSYLNEIRPDIVLLDIILKGTYSGLDLANILSESNIPFIYISANSDASILEKAKNTRPSGFLVKPFRERDVLVALDIASYKHTYTAGLIRKQESILKDLLSGIVNKAGSGIEKLQLITKAFRPYIPFDYVHFDLCAGNENPDLACYFNRTGYDDYEVCCGQETIEKYGIRKKDFQQWRKTNASGHAFRIENDTAFERSCQTEPFLENLKQAEGIKSRMVFPLHLDEGALASVGFYSKGLQTYNQDHPELLNPIKSLLSILLSDIRHQHLNNLSVRPDKFIKKTDTTKESLLTEGIVGKSPQLLHALDLATQVAPFDSSVLILGETGVGKEGLVNAIHHLSGRNKKPLVKINCAAIPATLIESELFGHEKGAFTGAFDKRIGKFEQADGGTIFLDELGEIPLEIQIKLLRVLQEREFERLGGRTTIKVDVRVIAATNRNLYQDVADGRFRMDLYYRINVFPIVLPPLRERPEDIPLLVNHFLIQYAGRCGRPPKQLSQDALHQLLNYSWPGNIRELQHIIERNIVLSHSNLITAIELPVSEQPGIKTSRPDERFPSIAEVDRAHIISALKKCNGKVAGKGGAAEILNMPASTLSSKMKKLGIKWKYLFTENI